MAAAGLAAATAAAHVWDAVVFAGLFAILDIVMLLRARHRARQLRRARYDQADDDARELRLWRTAPAPRAESQRSSRARRVS